MRAVISRILAVCRIAFVFAASVSVLGAAAQTTTPPAARADSALIADLVAANRILADEKIFDAFGHVSARDSRNPNRYYLARSLAPALVTAADILEFDLDSTAAGARGAVLYLERFIHGEIYRTRPDVMAIVHNHSPTLIPFGVSSVPLRPMSQLAGFIGDGVPVFDIRAAAGMTDMLVSNPDRGRALAASLGSRAAVLMRGHGVTVVGSTIPIAVGRSVYLERNATLQAQAIALGGNITYLDPEEARQVIAAGENGGYLRAWELWKRKAMAAPK